MGKKREEWVAEASAIFLKMDRIVATDMGGESILKFHEVQLWVEKLLQSNVNDEFRKKILNGLDSYLYDEFIPHHVACFYKEVDLISKTGGVSISLKKGSKEIDWEKVHQTILKEINFFYQAIKNYQLDSMKLPDNFKNYVTFCFYYQENAPLVSSLIYLNMGPLMMELFATLGSEIIENVTIKKREMSVADVVARVEELKKKEKKRGKPKMVLPKAKCTRATK